MSEEHPQLVKLCSRDSHHRSFANFTNKTQQDVSVEWLNFDGDHISYKKRLHPGEVLTMHTFKTHPWVFYDSDCRHPLTFLPDRHQIYFPVEWEGGPRIYHEIHIVNPIHDLEQLCLNHLHRHLSIERGYKAVESFSNVVDDMSREMLLSRTHRDSLNKMSKDQNNSNTPIYILPVADEDDD